MRTYIAIVVDQLGWADIAGMKFVAERLGAPRRILTPYFPTQTETAHATIGVGALPRDHGVIGASWFVESTGGLIPISIGDNIYSRPGCRADRPLVQALAEDGIQTIVVAGKHKVAQLLDPRPSLIGPGVRFSYQIEGGRFVRRALNADGTDCLASFKLDQITCPRDHRDPRMNACLLSIAFRLLNQARDLSQPAFLVVALPYLDTLGHEAGHGDPIFGAALEDIDRRIAIFLDKTKALLKDDIRVFICGDHGCRTVERMVYPEGEGEEFRLILIDRSGQREELPLPWPDLRSYWDSEGTALPAVLLDGGMLRLWAKPGRKERVIGALRDGWSNVLAGVFNSDQLKDTVRFGDQSEHSAWGDIIGLAQQDVALCRPEWIRGRNGLRFPRGEHGSDFDDDRAVPLWGGIDTVQNLGCDVRDFLLGSEPKLA